MGSILRVRNPNDPNDIYEIIAIRGEPGVSPHIGENGNWFVGDTDTGVSASGGSTNITIDDKINADSTNPVQNKVLYNIINTINNRISELEKQINGFSFIYSATAPSSGTENTIITLVPRG